MMWWGWLTIWFIVYIVQVGLIYYVFAEVLKRDPETVCLVSCLISFGAVLVESAVFHYHF